MHAPVGVEREDIEDDLHKWHSQPDRHEDSSPLVAPGLSAIQQPHHHAEVAQGIGRAVVVVHLEQPFGLCPLCSIYVGDCIWGKTCTTETY